MADFIGKEDAVVVGMGCATDMMLLSASVEAGDLIITQDSGHAPHRRVRRVGQQEANRSDAATEDCGSFFIGREDAVVVDMRCATNWMLPPVIVGAGNRIISDELDHVSTVKIRFFEHIDARSLEAVVCDAIKLGG